MRIEEAHCWIATDEAGDEGVAYVETAGGTRIPLLAATAAQADAMRPMAERLARVTGARLTRATFSTRTDGETVGDA